MSDLREALREMELHDDTGDPFDEGFMECWRRVSTVLNAVDVSEEERVISVWPCDHGNVLVEHSAVPLGMACSQCGAHPEHYVPRVSSSKEKQ